MKVSNIRNKNFGYTLIELVVVIAGLAALGSFSIPAVLNSIKLNKVDEAKAIMNGYAADCLGKYRISTNQVTFIENSTPDELDNIKLSTLGYQIDGDKNKCSHLAIKPLDENDTSLYPFDFRMTSEGRVTKTATPSNNPRFLNSCRSWAGKNCGLSEAQKAEFARLEALAKAKSVCLSNYSSWLSAGNSGGSVSWDNEKETCTRAVFAFEGIPVNSLEAVEQAQLAKYGRACADWRAETKEASKNVSPPNGSPQSIDPECGGVDYYYHSGNEFTTTIAWTAYDNQLKEQACIQDRSDALSQKKSGQYTYGPTPGPDPCGKVVWLCDGAEYNSQNAYQNTSCYQPVVIIPIDPCSGWTPNPMCDYWPSRKNSPMCKCPV